MPSKRRKVEVHRLVISGLPEGTKYGQFLTKIRGKSRPVADVIMKSGEKSHALNQATLYYNRLFLRFLSFTKGHRPDILDTNQFALQPNPLSPEQTNVEWTHILGGRKNGRYILLIERNFHGIWPTTLERYLQTLIDRYYEEGKSNEPITVNIDAEPGPDFMARVNALDRITEATVRVSRPNPGWWDLQTELGKKAEESDAKKVDITMSSRFKSSLDKQKGIIRWIKEAINNHELGFAAIKGRRGKQSDQFTTDKLGKQTAIDIELDDRGQIRPDDALEKLFAMYRGLD